MTTAAPSGPGPHDPPRLTGMADAVLAEIAARLAEAAGGAKVAPIELTAMPLTSDDRADLQARLGRGEVFATIESAGRSEVWETLFSGVWVVRHFGESDRVASETIEIGAAPAILLSHRADMAAAASRLAKVAPPAGQALAEGSSTCR